MDIGGWSIQNVEERANVAGIPGLATQCMRERSSFRFQQAFAIRIWASYGKLPTFCRQRNGTRRDSPNRTFNPGVALSRTVWAATGIPREQTTPVIGVWSFRGIARTNIKKDDPELESHQSESLVIGIAIQPLKAASSLMGWCSSTLEPVSKSHARTSHSG